MKKLLAVGLLTVGLLTVGQAAESEESVGKFYLGIGIGQSNIDSKIDVISGTPGIDKKDTSKSLTVGIEVNKFLAFEATYKDLGEVSINGTLGDSTRSSIYGNTFNFPTDFTEHLKVKTFGLSAIGSYPINNYIKPFVSIGYHKYTINIENNKDFSSIYNYKIFFYKN